MSSYNLTNEQSQEIYKCSQDFVYFCEKYVKINSWRGNAYQQMPFKLFEYQQDLFQHWEDNRLSLNCKFRQGGFTTTVVIYGLWQCLFKLDHRVLYLAKTDREAIDDAGHVAEYALSHLPEWLKGLSSKNHHMKKFDTGSSILFHTPEAACGKKMDLLIIDEAAHIKDIDKHWKAMWPVLSAGGKCVIQSTVYLDDDWFWDRIIDARAGVGQFKEFRCHYTDRPEFAEPDWEQTMLRNIGQRNWQMEVLQKPVAKIIVEDEEEEIKKSKRAGKWRSVKDEWCSSHQLTPEITIDQNSF